MSAAFEVVLHRRPDGRWTTEALQLPTARLVALRDESGADLPFQIQDNVVGVGKRTPSALIGRIELSEMLAKASAIEEAKLSFEREKAAGEERQGRRTLIVSVVTALVSALATIGVAAITTSSSGKQTHQPQANVYRDLNECRDGLNNLKTLSTLDQQTLPDLRTAVGRQADDCIKRLSAAMAASSP